jgi:hypothetical protein
MDHVVAHGANGTQRPPWCCLSSVVLLCRDTRTLALAHLAGTACGYGCLFTTMTRRRMTLAEKHGASVNSRSSQHKQQQHSSVPVCFGVESRHTLLLFP